MSDDYDKKWKHDIMFMATMERAKLIGMFIALVAVAVTVASLVVKGCA
jgi:hypothetical protein